jgi:hypothetical protein
VLGRCMWWKDRDFFKESPIGESLRVGTFVDSYYCVACYACLESAWTRAIPISGQDGTGRMRLEGYWLANLVAVLSLSNEFLSPQLLRLSSTKSGLPCFCSCQTLTVLSIEQEAITCPC